MLWPLIAGALILATVFGLRQLAHPWAAAHAADVGAFALLEAYGSLLAVLLVVFGGFRGLGDRLGFHFTSWWHIGVALGAWTVSLTVGGILTYALAPVLGPARSNAADVLRVGHDPLFVAMVVPTISWLAPACEELLFRGALYGWLRTRVPLAGAVAVSAAAFAGLHLIVPLFPVLFVFGVATALIYEYTGSTLNSFAMHATQNTLAVVATYMALSSGAMR